MRLLKPRKLDSRIAASFVAVVVLVGSGSLYRRFGDLPEMVSGSEVVLPVPLEHYPLQIAGWRGEDIPVPPSIEKATGNDDYFSRLYVDETTGRWGNVYVAFSARPGTMLGHRPQACYPSAGWVHDGTERIKLQSRSGRKLPALLHRFHRPGPNREDIVVLNYYVVNGELTDDDGVFSGLGWRTPSINGQIARYVAQVQVSSTMESCVREAAVELSDSILAHLPDSDGRVQAAGYRQEAAVEMAARTRRDR